MAFLSQQVLADAVWVVVEVLGQLGDGPPLGRQVHRLGTEANFGTYARLLLQGVYSWWSSLGISWTCFGVRWSPSVGQMAKIASCS
jgi:hypothetical protein